MTSVSDPPALLLTLFTRPQLHCLEAEEDLVEGVVAEVVVDGVVVVGADVGREGGQSMSPLEYPLLNCFALQDANE